MVNKPIRIQDNMLVEPLSKDEIFRIHISALEILKKTGIKVMRQEALELLDNAGAIVDYRKETAYLPSHLIEEAIDRAPKQVILKGRTPENIVSFEEKSVYFTNSAAAFITDLEGRYREPTKRDTADFVRLADALENVHVVSRPPARDVPVGVMEVHEFEAVVNNTTKPFHINMYNGAVSVRRLMEMSVIVLGGEEEAKKSPLFLSGGCCSSPLFYDKLAVDIVMENAKYGMPTYFAGQPDLGGTGPVTTAGSIALATAEFLAGVTISQLVRKGTPNMYMGFAYGIDMRTGQAATGSPEHSLVTAATAQMSRYYHIPCIVIANTDAYISDAQEGYEKATSLMTAVLSGANLVFGIGTLGPSLSFEVAVIDNEIANIVRRIAEGIEVTDETLAVEIIKKVGPGGHFITEQHTRKHFRKELFMAKISNKKSYGSWMKEGSKSVSEKARRLAKEIVKTHKPEPLHKDIRKELRSYIENLKGHEQNANRVS